MCAPFTVASRRPTPPLGSLCLLQVAALASIEIGIAAPHTGTPRPASLDASGYGNSNQNCAGGFFRSAVGTCPGGRDYFIDHADTCSRAVGLAAAAAAEEGLIVMILGKGSYCTPM